MQGGSEQLVRVHPKLQIAFLIHIHSSAAQSTSELDGLLDDVCFPLLEKIEEGTSVPLSLHISGPLLQYAVSQAPGLLSRLKQAVRDRRVEMVGGTFVDAVLSSIPPQDALGQMHFFSNFLESNLGRRPKGAWLSLAAWDPAVIGSLREADFHWTLVDGDSFQAVGIDPWDVHGHFTTERNGKAITVFPIDNGLSRSVTELDASALAASLRQLSARPQAPALVSLALDGRRLIESGHHTSLFACLRSNVHWLKSRLFSAALESVPSRGGVYLGQSAWSALAPWCRPVLAADFSEQDRPHQPVIWHNSLARYPSANRIHKRMLRVSERVDTLRKALARQHKKGKNISAAKRLLEKACVQLWRAQSHDVYWHGGPLHLGVYDPALRASTLRDLLATEKVVARLLGGREPQAWDEKTADFDGDGNKELLVRTQTLQALIDTSSGGGLLELDLMEPGIALQTSFDPIHERYHDASSGTEVQLVTSEEADEPVTSIDEEASIEVVPALDRMSVGHLQRGAFIDHFLGAETSLASFARGQYPELGSFAGEAYEVVGSGNHGAEGEVTLGRSGVVEQGEDRALVRIEKRYSFDLEHPRLTLTHRIANRSREAASAWFGLEWTFGIPSGRPDTVKLRVEGTEGRDEHCLSDGPVPFHGISWLEWEDPGSGLLVVLELDTAHDVWWMPVRTVSRGPEGWREDIQGNTLLFHKRTEVWGNEERLFELRLSFHTES
jgi:hypothetical protein